jgi:hypothetical protein
VSYEIHFPGMTSTPIKVPASNTEIVIPSETWKQIAFLREWFRLPRIETRCRLHGFVSLKKPFRKKIEAQLKRFVEIFGPLNPAWNFGFVLAGKLSDLHFMVGELTERWTHA